MSKKTLRYLFFCIADIFIFSISLLLAFMMRFSNADIPNEFYKGLLLSMVTLVSIKMALMWLFRLYKVPWRFFSLAEARKIFYVHILAASIFIGIYFLFKSTFNPFPRSVVFIDMILSYTLISGFRISKRMFLDYKKSPINSVPCIVVGATNKAIHILKGMKQGYINYYAVGVVDNRKDLIGSYCGGFLVKSEEDIPSIIKESGAKVAIVALALDPNDLKELYDKLLNYGLDDIKLFSLLGENKEKIRDISIEDLLARKPKDLDSKAVQEFIFNKVVMVTGAGGTIGSEICKQCLKFGAKKLIMVDHSEFNLYKIDQDTNQDKRNILKMINIVYEKELEEIFATFKPEVIIHAAAYKHVPMCEFNPHMAIKNNIIGTKNVVDFAKKYKTKKVVLISTDKAVRPTNIMGATKRVCELYCVNSSVANETEIVAVRFGNVLGSSGSVIPKFKEQIKNNESLSVTHPDIVRYFMLVSEACQLVLQAASIANGGELFVLDMGEPVKIVDLATRMLQLSKKEHLGINFVGLRPGEKLYEELLIDKNDKNTKYESIFVTHSDKFDIDELNSKILKLKDLEDEDVISGLKEIVKDFNHLPN